MQTIQELQTLLQKTLNTYGQPVCLKFYTQSGASASYDDDRVLTQSGSTLWCSGMVQSLSSKYGSSDNQLVAQGRILFDDMKLFINGSVYTNGTQPMKIGVGSPTPQWFKSLPEGVDVGVKISNDQVYKKIYIRNLTNGSLAGE